MPLSLQIPYLSVTQVPGTGLAKADAQQMDEHTNLCVSTSARISLVHA